MLFACRQKWIAVAWTRWWCKTSPGWPLHALPTFLLEAAVDSDNIWYRRWEVWWVHGKVVCVDDAAATSTVADIIRPNPAWSQSSSALPVKNRVLYRERERLVAILSLGKCILPTSHAPVVYTSPEQWVAKHQTFTILKQNINDGVQIWCRVWK